MTRWNLCLAPTTIVFENVLQLIVLKVINNINIYEEFNKNIWITQGKVNMTALVRRKTKKHRPKVRLNCYSDHRSLRSYFPLFNDSPKTGISSYKRALQRPRFIYSSAHDLHTVSTDWHRYSSVWSSANVSGSEPPAIVTLLASGPTCARACCIASFASLLFTLAFGHFNPSLDHLPSQINAAEGGG
jgi:hypothetical protein